MKYKRFTITAIIVMTLVIVSGLTWQRGLVATLTMPACSDPVLTTLPSSEANIDSITPLGNISLPQHALPTEHTYHVLKRGADDLPLNTEVVAPANLMVTTITYISSVRNGQQRDNDYQVNMIPCKYVTIQFDHIRELSPKLAAAYAANKPSCQETERAGDHNKYCRGAINLKLSAGELIGVAGGGQPTGFDFGATDRRVKPLEFANNGRYSNVTRRTICPYDLYDQKLRSRFYNLLGDGTQRRTVEPICGTIAEDKPGTAQGNWFLGKGKSTELEQKQKTVSLIHDNVDATLGLLVIGSTNNKIIFTPTHSGGVNREFGEVAPDGQIYCYQPDALINSRATYGVSNPFTGSVAVRLVSATELDMEVRTTSCDSTAFSQPTRYSR